MLVFDSGGVSKLAERSARAAALIIAFKQEGVWPPLVSSVVLECLTMRQDKDARTNQFLKSCDVEVVLPKASARRAAHLRWLAKRRAAVDAVVVTVAEQGGTV